MTKESDKFNVILYLTKAHSQDLISDAIYRASIVVLDSLIELAGVPDACPSPEKSLLFTWDRGYEHWEVEIVSDKAAEFFYRNKVSGETLEIDYDPGVGIPRSVIAKLENVL